MCNHVLSALKSLSYFVPKYRLQLHPSLHQAGSNKIERELLAHSEYPLPLYFPLRTQGISPHHLDNEIQQDFLGPKVKDRRVVPVLYHKSDNICV